MDLPDTVYNHLQTKGERLTISRRLVIEVLCSRAGHWSIGDIRKHIETRHQGQNLPEPTVYRILQWLKGLQLVSQTDMCEAGVVYEFIDTSPHHHLICLGCGYIIEVEDSLLAPLREKLATEYHFALRLEHMAIYGYCPGCAPQPEDTAAAP